MQPRGLPGQCAGALRECRPQDGRAACPTVGRAGGGSWGRGQEARRLRTSGRRAATAPGVRGVRDPDGLGEGVCGVRPRSAFTERRLGGPGHTLSPRPGRPGAGLAGGGQAGGARLGVTWVGARALSAAATPRVPCECGCTPGPAPRPPGGACVRGAQCWTGSGLPTGQLSENAQPAACGHAVGVQLQGPHELCCRLHLSGLAFGALPVAAGHPPHTTSSTLLPSSPSSPPEDSVTVLPAHTGECHHVVERDLSWPIQVCPTCLAAEDGATRVNRCVRACAGAGGGSQPMDTDTVQKPPVPGMWTGRGPVPNSSGRCVSSQELLCAPEQV